MRHPALALATAALLIVVVMPLAIGLAVLARIERRFQERVARRALGELELRIANPGATRLALYRAGRDQDEAVPVAVESFASAWLPPARYFLEANGPRGRLLYPVTFDPEHPGPNGDGSLDLAVRPMPLEPPALVRASCSCRAGRSRSRVGRPSNPRFTSDNVLYGNSRAAGSAVGGWIAYRSGWIEDTVQLGATAYGSAPLYDPVEKADTVLLAPGGEGYYVLGEAFGAVRYGEYAQLKGYRQLVLQQPYINAQDNAMTPNTFEGVTLGGTLGPFRYMAGYLTRIKTRNADRFVPMSEAAGAPGSDRGVAMFGVKLGPVRGLELQLAEQYGVDTFNTLFARVEQVWSFGDALRLQLGAQFTDQRSVGDALVVPKGVPEWTTRNGSGRVALGFRELTSGRAGASPEPGTRSRARGGFPRDTSPSSRSRSTAPASEPGSREWGTTSRS